MCSSLAMDDDDAPWGPYGRGYTVCHAFMILCSYILAAWVPDIFCYFYLVKNYKFSNNSTATKAGEKNKQRFGILENF